MSRITFAWKATILSFLLFLCFSNGPLYDQDEAAYAGFAKTMLGSGNYILQEFPFSLPHRKPPLHLWITSLSFQTFGVSELSLRIFPALWISLCLLLTYLSAKQLFTEKIAQLSWLILFTSLYFPINGKIALVDPLLVFCETLGFYCLLVLVKDKSKNKLLYTFLFWVSILMGVLTKGPPILLYLGGICFFFLWQKETRSLVWSLQPWFGLPLALLPFSIWVYFVWQETNGEMIQWMFEWYVQRRATDPVFGQSGPPGTYFLLFWITLFPWSVFFPLWLKQLYRKRSEFKAIFLSKESFLLFSALFFGWFLYEWMQSKLPSYPLAAYPILAILLAKFLHESVPNVWIQRVFYFALAQTLLLHLLVAPILNEKRKDTQVLAKSWKQSVTKTEAIYSFKNYALPSLAFYLDTQIQVVADFLEFQSLPKGSIVLIDLDNYMLLSQWGKGYKVLSDAKSVWAYDRNKTIQLLLIQID